MTEPPPAAGRERALAVLTAAAASLLLLLAGSRRWVTVTATDALGTERSTALDGSQAAPEVAALALVALAATATVLLARRAGRLMGGAGLVLAGAGAAIASAVAARSPSVAPVLEELTGLSGAAAERSVTGAAVTAWPAVAAAAGAALAGAGLLVLLRGRRWGGPARRYQRDGGPDDATAAQDAWAALSRGDDPTAGGRMARTREEPP